MRKHPSIARLAGPASLALAIAWLPAKGERQPDPMFMLAGGPGQSALESFPGIAPALAEVRKKRDIVLVDQRGTGLTAPINCPSLQNLVGAYAPAAAI